MLKRSITFETFDGDIRTKEYYFNLTKTELLDLEMQGSDGMRERIQRIIDAGDNAALIAEFKSLILLAYGERSEDGESFMKSEEISARFASTAAFDSLFVEMITSETAAADFITGIMPSDVAQELNVAQPTPAAPAPAAPPAPPAPMAPVPVEIHDTPQPLPGS